MVIYGVSFDMVGKQPIVLLKTRDGNKFLPIWIGHPEAAAILMKLQGANTPRPMTHDLITEMLSELDVSCSKVAVTELRENTFYAAVTLQMDGREVEIDSRPSDALALAVRTGAPIFAAEDVIAESAIEFEHEVEDQEEVVEKFKDFLDNVSPEDFAARRAGERRGRQTRLAALARRRPLRAPAPGSAPPARRSRCPRRPRPGAAGTSRSGPGSRSPRARRGRRRLVEHQVDAGEAGAAEQPVRRAARAPGRARPRSPGSSAGQTKSVRPIS